MSLVSPELARRLKGLPPELLAHCRRVDKLCQELAPRLALDPVKAEAAALLHDLARALPPAQLLALARSYGLPLSPVEEAAPMLLHGPVAAQMLRREFGVEDGGVLRAIACHTAGRGGMSLLDKALFLCDKTEPGKARGEPELERARALAASDLDRALLTVLDWQIAISRKMGWPPHPATALARASLVKGG